MNYNKLFEKHLGWFDPNDYHLHTKTRKSIGVFRIKKYSFLTLVHAPIFKMNKKNIWDVHYHVYLMICIEEPQ